MFCWFMSLPFLSGGFRLFYIADTIAEKCFRRVKACQALKKRARAGDYGRQLTLGFGDNLPTGSFQCGELHRHCVPNN